MTERTENPLVSVIVPVYKVEKYLEQCVESILGQTYSNLEVWLVDDGSPDNCPVLCDEIAQRDPRVRVIHKANGGLSSARNAALDVCTGEYICFVDSDDWIEPTLCADALEMIRARDLDIVMYPDWFVRTDGERVKGSVGYPGGTVAEPMEVMEKCLRSEIGGHACKRFCHRRCWEQVRFPEGRLFEDLAVTHLPFLYAERPVGFLDKPLYNYRMNEAGISLRPSPKGLYHMFLGQRELYRFAVDRGLTESAEACLSLAADKGLEVFHDQYRRGWTDMEAELADIRAFLRENWGDLMRSPCCSRNLRLHIRLFCGAEPLFRLCVKGSALLRKQV